MKLFRGANLWLKNHSNAAPFGPHGGWFDFGESSASIFSHSLIFSVKRRESGK